MDLADSPFFQLQFRFTALRWPRPWWCRYFMAVISFRILLPSSFLSPQAINEIEALSCDRDCPLLGSLAGRDVPEGGTRGYEIVCRQPDVWRNRRRSGNDVCTVWHGSIGPGHYGP